jgi:hypothetical protein
LIPIRETIPVGNKDTGHFIFSFDLDEYALSTYTDKVWYEAVSELWEMRNVLFMKANIEIAEA